MVIFVSKFAGVGPVAAEWPASEGVHRHGPELARPQGHI